MEYSEKGIKEEPNWPANIKKRKAEEEKKKESEKEDKDKSDSSKDDKKSKDADSKDQSDGDDADKQAKDGDTKKQSKDGDAKKQSKDGKDDSKQDKDGDQTQDDDDEEDDKLPPDQAAFLKAVKHEQRYISELKVNDGQGHSHVKNRISTMIDEADQFTPDNWIPRSAELTRHTGKHPLNAEAPISRLFDSGFITPNELHYVRNHGAVPRIMWEFHKLNISCEGRSKEFSMHDIESDFQSYNIPVFIGCDGNRRKELNLMKRTTGFDWGCGAIGCAYWRGALLREVLVAAGVLQDLHFQHGERYFIHFKGADNPNNVHYETSIPLEYALDPTNDLLLAYEMNDVPLPPDHGYPLRIVIPGYVGARHVKWLQEIWISSEENDSYFHIHDNRIVSQESCIGMLLIVIAPEFCH